ncbi:hypothetical protein NKG95_31155 [Mesorhizobium sp. M1423]|uniref:hypothetical protein n=1 Tax=Mesorhizobium sp. M1423 TaxID=2957101 RepID=UPI0033368539
MTTTQIASKLHLSDLTLLTGRLLLSLLFLHEGLELASHFDGAAKAMAALGVSSPLLIATPIADGQPGRVRRPFAVAGW